MTTTAIDETPEIGSPPRWSLEAEQAVLGAILLDNTAHAKVADILTERSFWHRMHGITFRLITALVIANKPADILTVAAAAKDAGEDIGGIAYLTAMSQVVASSGNARRYAEIVSKKASEREIIAAADMAMTIAQGNDDPGEKLDRIAGVFEGLNRAQTKKAPRPMAELMLRAVDRYTALADGKTAPGWRTGVLPLDRILGGGLRPGKVYCVAARPSVGKSSAAREFALSTATDGIPTLLLSQEMPDDEVADCFVSRLGRVSNERIATGRLDQSEWHAITDAVDLGSRLPLFVDDEGGLTLNDIRSKARGIKGLKVLLLDYLQLSQSTLTRATTNDQVAELSKGLKKLALEMGVALVVLSQLNRDVERRGNPEPVLSDLRDSGAIEQDCDVVVMLWSAKEYDGGHKVIGWKVAKHRGGKKGKFAMEFDGARYAWSESGYSLDAPARTERRGNGAFE